MVRGIISCFRRKTWFCWQNVTPKNPQSGFPTFQIDVQMQSSIMRNVAEGFYISEKGFYISEKGFYIFEKGFYIFEERQIVQIMQIRWLDNVNHANKVTR